MFRLLRQRLRLQRVKSDGDVDALASRAAITRFLFVEDAPQPVDLCFILGCPTPTNMDPAIALYRAGLAPFLMIAGHGPIRQPVPESVLFRDYALARHIPGEAMLIETESTNTKENFAFSEPLIAARFGWDDIRTVALVAKPYHMRRAIMTARQQWPGHLRLIARPSQRADDVLATDWWRTPTGRDFVLKELRAIGTYALQGDLGGF